MLIYYTDLAFKDPMRWLALYPDTPVHFRTVLNTEGTVYRNEEESKCGASAIELGPPEPLHDLFPLLSDEQLIGMLSADISLFPLVKDWASEAVQVEAMHISNGECIKYVDDAHATSSVKNAATSAKMRAEWVIKRATEWPTEWHA